MIDIIVTTRNRPEYLKRTLAHIYERTRHPHRIHVIDDASEKETTGYLLEELRCKRIHEVVLRGERQGQMANYNVGAWLSYSDPVVFVDDDVLCPDVKPCWLQRGVEAMKARPKLGLLALNHPGAKNKKTGQDGEVILCKSVGGVFLFVRRSFLLQHPLPHKRYNFNAKPTEVRCKNALDNGWQVGYLANTYCYHIGVDSAILPGTKYKGRFVRVKDWKTLEPVGA